MTMIDKRLIDLFPSIDTTIPQDWYRIALETRINDYDVHDADGALWYTVHGKSYVSTENFCKALLMTDEDIVIWMLKFGNILPNYYRDGRLHGN